MKIDKSYPNKNDPDVAFESNSIALTTSQGRFEVRSLVDGSLEIRAIEPTDHRHYVTSLVVAPRFANSIWVGFTPRVPS